MAVLTRLLICAIAALAAPPGGTAAAERREQASERDIKAAFLYNFTKYIEWPPDAFPSAGEPFRFCVLADEDFTRRVSSFVVGEGVQGRPIHFVVPSVSEIRRCQILFIGRQAAGRIAALLAAVAGRPVLTVGETPDFIERGGVVLFEIEDGRVRFDIHLGLAAHARLTVNSKLVRVARRVREGTGR